MAEPISEQIVARAVTTLSAITRANSYPINASVKRFDERGNAAGMTNYDVLIEVEANAPEWKPGIAPLTRDGYEMNVNFICTVKAPESGSNSMDTLLHRVYASVYKAWAADYAFDGLAINSELGKPAEVMRGNVPATIIPCKVWFYTEQGDPFTQTP